LTTLHIPREKIGHLMSQILTGGDEVKSNKIVIEPDFVVRASVGKAKL
jgi:DNA-binding LacI/PurR family transcriptional regulator